MKRLIENTVLPGFVTAWRLASCPTSRSPVLVKATTDGTVRPPSADAMTVGSPPSMTATTEFVVPRSMPMILPMGGDAPSSALVSGQGFGRTAGFDRIGGVSRGGDRDEGRPDHAIAQPVTAADLLDDLALGAFSAWNVQDRLVLAGIERSTRRGVDRCHAFTLEELAELAIDRRDALEPGILGDRGGTRLDRAVKVVGEVEDLADQVL